MRIAAISVAPIFPNYVIGGSQKILADVTAGLKNLGHDVQIWCTATESHNGDFDVDGVAVHPELKFLRSLSLDQPKPCVMPQSGRIESISMPMQFICGTP